MKHRVQSGFLATALVLAAAVPASAQEAGIERNPVTIALVESIDDSSAEAMILRELEGISRDVILLEEKGANTAQLIAALATLVAAPAALGPRLESITRMRVDKRTGKNFFSQQTKKDIGRLIRRLKRAEPTHLIGVGQVRNVTVWIPAETNVSVVGSEY